MENKKEELERIKGEELNLWKQELKMNFNSKTKFFEFRDITIENSDDSTIVKISNNIDQYDIRLLDENNVKYYYKKLNTIQTLSIEYIIKNKLKYIQVINKIPLLEWNIDDLCLDQRIKFRENNLSIEDYLKNIVYPGDSILGCNITFRGREYYFKFDFLYAEDVYTQPPKFRVKKITRYEIEHQTCEPIFYVNHSHSRFKIVHFLPILDVLHKYCLGKKILCPKLHMETIRKEIGNAFEIPNVPIDKDGYFISLLKNE